jgi:osmotically-inducible protein OsmY
MADRYDERFRPEYGRQRYSNEDRGMMDRAGDEVRSWFGDDEAARRRERDEREADRGRAYDRGYESERSEPRRMSERSYMRDAAVGSRPGEFAWRETDRRYLRDRGDTSYGRPSARDYGGAMGSSGGFGGAAVVGPDDTTGPDYGRYGRSGERSSQAGRGPKGYRRSDERIREDVSDRLTDDPLIDASGIEVTVSNAEVTLAGFVRERDDKRRAEDIAERISGVREVHNSLRLRRDEDTSLTQGASTATEPGGRAQGKQPDR